MGENLSAGYGQITGSNQHAPTVRRGEREESREKKNGAHAQTESANLILDVHKWNARAITTNAEGGEKTVLNAMSPVVCFVCSLLIYMR